MNAARILSPIVFAGLYLASVACSAPAIPTTDYDVGSKSKKQPKDDVEDEVGEDLPKQKKSDSSEPVPAPAPAPSSSADPAPAPTPTPTPDSKPPVDPAACNDLGRCCQNITNVVGRISCLAVQAKGDPATCLKSLIGCEAATGLGGSSGSSGGSSGGTRCYDDYDCPGVQLCYSDGTCR